MKPAKNVSSRKSYVIDPDRRRIIYVSGHGSDQYDGDSPDKPIRSIPRLARLLHDDTKVLFRRGDTFDVSAPLDIKNRNIIFGAYDDPTSPGPTCCPDNKSIPRAELRARVGFHFHRIFAGRSSSSPAR